MPSPSPEEFCVQLYGHDGSVKQRLGAIGDALKTTSVDKSIESTENTTSIPLGANSTFTGAWVDTLTFGTVVIGCHADVSSATNGLKIEYAATTDGHIIQDDSFTILANVGKVFSVGMANRYMRIKYTNGATPQTDFHLQTILKNVPIKPSSHRTSDVIVGDDDAELVKATLSGVDDNGVFQNGKMDYSGNLRVNSFPYTYSIAEGDISGHTALLKFGTRTAIASNTPSLVWEGTAAQYTYLTSAEQLKISSSSAADSSAGTGVRTLTIVGLDGNWNELTETITMNGITAVTTTGSFLRIYRAYSATCGTSLTNVGTIAITNNAGTNQLLVITVGDGQTLMTMWTVPLGKTAYLLNATLSTDTNKGCRVSLRARINDGATTYPWLIKYRAYVEGGNNSFSFAIPFKIPAKTDIEVQVLTPAAAGITSAGATFELWYEA